MYQLVRRKHLRKMRKMKFWRRRLAHLDTPRLCVYRSLKHIHVQLINDNVGRVLASASSIEEPLRKTGLSGKAMAVRVGAEIAARAKAAGVTKVVFDRNGFNYHGRIQALADSAREAGLQF